MPHGVNRQSDISAAHSLHPRLRTANDTGSSVDLLNYFRATIVTHVGGISGSTTETHALRVEESTDNTTFTTVAAGDLNGTMPSITSQSTIGSISDVEYLGGSRYLRVYASVSSPTSGAIYSAHVVRGGARTNPV